MDVQIGMDQSIQNTIKLNEHFKLLNTSATSIKINQSFSQSIKASHSSVQELKAETEKISIKSSLISSIETMKAKSNEVKSSFKKIGKGNGVKDSIEDQSKSLQKFIQDIRQNKISIKAVIDISKESIQKISNCFSFSANMQMSSSIEITLPETSLKDAQEGIKVSLEGGIKSVADTLKELKLDASFTDSIVQMKDWLGEIKTLFEGAFGSSEGSEVVEEQCKRFGKLREEIKKAKEEILILNNSKKQVNVEEQRISKRKQDVEVAIARENINDTLNKIKVSPIVIGLMLAKEGIESKLSSIQNMKQNIKLGLELVQDNLKTKLDNLKVSPIAIGLELAREGIENKITSLKNKIASMPNKVCNITLALKDIASEKLQPIKNKISDLMKKPKSIVVKALANTSLAMDGLKNLRGKCKEKFSVAVSIVDKTREGFKAIAGKMKMLSSPVSFIAKSIVSPALAAQKEDIKNGKKIPESSNAVAQIERVQKTIEKLKSSVFSAIMPILVSVLKPVADWVEKNQPKIDAFIQKIAAKIAASAPRVQAIVTSVIGKISMVISALAPVIVKIIAIICKNIIAMKPVFEKIFNSICSIIIGLKPVFDKIIDTVKFLGDVWISLWPTICKILQSAWGIIKPILSILQSVAGIIVDIFKQSWPFISAAIEGVWKIIEPILGFMGAALEKVSKFAGWVADKVGGLLGKGGDSSSSGGKGNRHAFGMARVPYDDYPALLHEGERILTKQEANSSKGLGGISIAKLAETIVVREEADIDRITNSLVAKLQKTGFNMA